MSSYPCPACGATVPTARYCPACGEPNPDAAPPEPADDPAALTARLSTLAGEADGETVSFDALRSDYGQYDRPLGAYLFEGERPVGVLDSPGAVVEGPGGEEWRVPTAFRKTGHLVVTDERTFALLPTTDSGLVSGGLDPDTVDQVVPVDHGSVLTVGVDSGWRSDALRLETADGYAYEFEVAGSSADPGALTDVAGAIRNAARERDATGSDPPEVVREVDDAVAGNETAAELFRALADRFDDRDAATAFDAAAAEADSLDELLAALRSVPGVADGADGADEETGWGGDGPLPRPADVGQPRVGDLRRRVSRVLRDAEPAEVGKYTIAAGVGFGAYAVSAPFSTAAGLAAIATGGAVTGAYASAHPDSVVAEIDPVTLATRARVGGKRWRTDSVPGAGGAGAAVGAIEHVAAQDVSSEQTQWLDGLDADRIRQGAELGARAAETRADVENTALATVLGGGIGLAYGYADDGGELDDLEALLDDDLSEELTPGESAGNAPADGETAELREGTEPSDSADGDDSSPR